MSSTISSLRSSPIPDLAYDSYRSLSLREQTLIKRQFQFQQKPECNQNQLDSPLLNSRYKENPRVDCKTKRDYEIGARSHHLNKPNYTLADGTTHTLSKYSGESSAFWILLTILVILAVVNALLTFIIFGVLRLGAGMESVEFLPKILKFYGLVDLDDILKRDGILEGLSEQPVEISGEDGDLKFVVPFGNQPSLVIDRNIINITQVSEFHVVDKSGKEVFSTNTPTLGLPKGIKSLDVRLVKANRVTSAINSTLHMRSTTFAYLMGSEGTHMNGKQIVFAADQDIFLKSVTGNLILTGSDGIVFDVNALPLVKEDGVTRKSYTYATLGKREPQYQLCICMPEGKLFKVHIPVNNQQLRNKIGCSSVDNPCM